MQRIRIGWRVLAVALSLSTVAAVLSLGVASASTSAPSSTLGTSKPIRVERVGTVNLKALSAAAKRGAEGPLDAPNQEFGNWAGEEEKPEVPNGLGVSPPNPPTTPVVRSRDRTGWDGPAHKDQRLANNGNQFSLEPPDQGLCTGGLSPNGPGWGPEVVSSVNDALIVYDARGEQFTNAISLSEFYDLPPTFDRGRGVFGPFESDPKCYFDPDTQRWFHTMLVISQDPATGAFETPSYVYIAVSTSSEALGGYIIYRVDATDLDHPNCPCFGDQPLIGADATGFYVSTAEYSLEPFGGFFNGPQIYAFSKRGLESGDASAVHISGITHVVHNRTTGTVQPATSPRGVYETARHGTEYFLSGFDCVADAACAIAEGQFNRITVWALTGTQSLDTASPNLHLSRQDIRTQVYGTPVPMTQRDGPIPLGNYYGHTEVPVVNSNDSRMNQVVYSQGRLWSGINTLLAPGDHDGIQWFQVTPSVASGSVSGTLTRQGYVALSGRNNAAFPSIGVNNSGDGVIAFTVMGPKFFPSPAHVKIDTGGTTGAVQLVAQGFRPEDGFTCYPEPSGGSQLCRWGDYTASVATPSGAVISAVEYIPRTSRTFFANWGTFIWQVHP
jgi:hypothetical protein